VLRRLGKGVGTANLVRRSSPASGARETNGACLPVERLKSQTEEMPGFHVAWRRRQASRLRACTRACGAACAVAALDRGAVIPIGSL